MSYDEHLISMAGGDGEAKDPFAAIEARHKRLAHYSPHLADPDVTALLAMVREQRAQLDKLATLAEGWKPPSDNADLDDTQVWYSFAKHHAAQAIRNILGGFE